MVGSKVLHYNILEKLPGAPSARAGGDVYLAEDSRMRRRVLLEFLDGDAWRDEALRERVSFEVRTASMLSHPNIAAVYGLEEAGGRAFVVTEHVRGESLRALLERGPIDTDRAIDVALQILSALSGAHETGVVHRSLSPDRVVVTASGRVKVVDFAPARPADARYAAPERRGGTRADHRCDLFSFGVVLVEMLGAGFPAGLRAIVDRALEKDPERRYQSAHEIEVDLARFQAGLFNR
jgi:serine/threonine protein kinase